jgi:hypothetical protein
MLAVFHADPSVELLCCSTSFAAKLCSRYRSIEIDSYNCWPTQISEIGVKNGGLTIAGRFPMWVPLSFAEDPKEEGSYPHKCERIFVLFLFRLSCKVLFLLFVFSKDL